MIGLGVSSQTVYERDHAILKQYNPEFSKVVMLRSCRMPGYEERGRRRGKRNSAGYAQKLSQSLSRTRSKVLELAMCNDWDYFCTLTLAPENGDRQDLRAYQLRVSKWLNNLNYRHGWSIRYLLIPEPHEDGAWHMHGLFAGIPAEVLELFTLGDRLPYRIRNMLEDGRKIYNWPAYAQKFGFITCEPIRDREACAKYITKYITKDLEDSVSRLNQKLYLCSHGLKRSQVICRGPVLRPFIPDFFNEYVAVKTFRRVTDALALFLDSNEFDLQPIGFLYITGQTENGFGGVPAWVPV